MLQCTLGVYINFLGNIFFHKIIMPHVYCQDQLAPRLGKVYVYEFIGIICCYLIHTNVVVAFVNSHVYAQGTKDTRSRLCSFACNKRSTFSKEKHPWLFLDTKNLCWARTSSTLLLKVQKMWSHANLCL